MKDSTFTAVSEELGLLNKTGIVPKMFSSPRKISRVVQFRFSSATLLTMELVHPFENIRVFLFKDMPIIQVQKICFGAKSIPKDLVHAWAQGAET